MQVILSAPRGFCAGVVRAIEVVEICLERYGPPVYVKHQIVHNPYVVAELEQKGAITGPNKVFVLSKFQIEMIANVISNSIIKIFKSVPLPFLFYFSSSRKNMKFL